MRLYPETWNYWRKDEVNEEVEEEEEGEEEEEEEEDINSNLMD